MPSAAYRAPVTSRAVARILSSTACGSSSVTSARPASSRRPNRRESREPVIDGAKAQHSPRGQPARPAGNAVFGPRARGFGRRARLTPSVATSVGARPPPRQDASGDGARPGGCRRVGIEDRRQPAARLLERPALALRVVLELVGADLADAEVARIGVRDQDARDRGAGAHREAVGQRDPGARGGVEQLEQRALLGVVGLAAVAGRRADAAVALGDQLLAVNDSVRRVGPGLAANPLVHALRERLGEAVAERLEEDRVVVVVVALELLGPLALAVARR